jgi:hypothetical protein
MKTRKGIENRLRGSFTLTADLDFRYAIHPVLNELAAIISEMQGEIEQLKARPAVVREIRYYSGEGGLP